MRSKILLPVIFCAGVSLSGVAQFQNNVPQVKPLPPEATSIFRVVDRPIGSFTGTVPVNFPLCGISCGPLSASISLNYNGTGGIKVEENASTVGLGFSFSDGGGRIVQVVNGNADDWPSGLLHCAHRPSGFDCYDVNQLAYAAQGLSDLDPDIFYYDFNGVSGKFFFKENGTIVLNKNSGIKITYDYVGDTTTGIKRWIITDEKGNKYYFGKNKSGSVSLKTSNTYTYTSVNNGSSKTGTSNFIWYLTEARDMNEENIMTYTYQSCSGTWNNASGGAMMLYSASGTSGCSAFNINSDQTNVSTGAGEYIISKIQTNNGYLLFNSSADRKDAPWGRKINSIEVHDTTGGLIKKINFNYDYFNNWSTDQNILRLKLKNFSEFGSSGTDSLVHSFVYNESTNLPTRFSNSVDYWGFYNGVYNAELFPNIVFPVNSSTILINTIFANRIAVDGYAQADILTQINYPTGGYRQFFYEGNSALLLSGYMDQSTEPDYITNRSFTNSTFSFASSPTACQLDTFTVNSIDGGAQFTFNLSGVGVSCSGYAVKLYKTTTRGALTGGAQIGLTITNTPYNQWNLVNGYYRLEIYKPSSSCTFTSTTGSWVENILSTATITTPNGTFTRNNRRGGGVRVKQINDYDPVSNKTSTTQYLYKLYSKDSTLSSGLLVSPIQVTNYINTGSSCAYTSINVTSCYPMGTQGGSYVVYPEVRTIESGNGWTDQVFSYEQDYQQSGFPVTPATDGSPARGNLLEQRVYKADGTLLQKSDYTYVAGFQDYQEGYRSKPYYYDFANTIYDSETPQVNGAAPTHAACTDYQVSSVGFVPGTSIDSVFAAAKTFVTRTDRSYFYYGIRPVLKQVVTTINNGTIKYTTYKYPFSSVGDFTFGLTSAEQTTMTTLLNNNYMQPLEAVDSVKLLGAAGSLLSGSKLIFGTFNGTRLHLSQARSYTTLVDSTQLNFTQYDSSGNLQEQNKTNDSKEVYLWGYNKYYPVAKVTGSSYATVAALVNQSILNNPSSDAALQTELAKIRTGLAGSQAQVTTYSYSSGLGMSSMVDPSGKIIYYSYDAFGRLHVVKDQAGNVLKKYCYNYLGQAGSCSP